MVVLIQLIQFNQDTLTSYIAKAWSYFWSPVRQWNATIISWLLYKPCRPSTAFVLVAGLGFEPRTSTLWGSRDDQTSLTRYVLFLSIPYFVSTRCFLYFSFATCKASINNSRSSSDIRLNVTLCNVLPLLFWSWPCKIGVFHWDLPNLSLLFSLFRWRNGGRGCGWMHLI